MTASANSALAQGSTSKATFDPHNSLSLYEAALAHTPDFVYIIDLECRFLYANPALLKMWGRTRENAIGCSLLELGYEPWHAQMHAREIETVVATKQPIRSQVPFSGAAGRRIYEYIFSPIFDPDDNVIAISGTTRDVTDRVTAEEERQKAEERWRLGLAASEFVGTWDWDLRTNLVVADERFARLYSVDPVAAARGAPVEEYTKTFHPIDAERIAPKMDHVLTHGGDFEEEYRLVQPDASFRWVVARGRVHLDDAGKPIRFAGAVVDITERKRAEERMRENQQQLQSLTSAVPQQIWTAGADGRLDYVNEFTLNYTGDLPLSDGAITWTDVIHPADLERSRALWARSVTKGEAYETHQRIRHQASGCFRWHLSRAVPIRNSDGVITKWFGTNTDIDDQKRATDVVKEAQAHLKLMVDSAQDYAIISLDLMGHIVSWNHGAEAVFGYSPTDIIGRSIGFLFTEQDRRAGVPEQALQTARTLGRFKDDRWYVRENGERFYVSGTVAAMYDDENHVKGFIKIARDMTRDQQAQTALIEARNAAEAANIAKTEFLANMSHEIRTPMNAVIGLANILALSKPLTPKQQEYLKTLQLSADSLLVLINDMLDIAKIEARTVDLENVPFSLALVIQEVASMMAVRVREKGLRLDTQMECVEQHMFLGDPTRLRQIIINLCSNAVKFTDVGSVTLKILCSPSDVSNVTNVSIIVEDTGIGIAPEHLSTIFQKFVQADTSINRKYGGTGLGLAITKTLTEIMKGSIAVQSRAGIGSKFTVSIPLELAPLAMQETVKQHVVPHKSAAEPKRTGPKILLVEDYAPNILVAATFIEQFGYACDVATNGQEAIEKVKTTAYALILMDVQMHGINGLEATRLIRVYENQRELAPVPIIGMTAHALSGDRDRCISAGMDDYIPKPFNPDELRSMIDNAISGKLT